MARDNKEAAVSLDERLTLGRKVNQALPNKEQCMDTQKKALRDLHKEHRDENWQNLNWRAWGSWFSWGSPIGLSLGYGIVIVSTGIFIWLINH